MNAKAVSSDGRPLPTEFISDTIEILPGERYGVLVESAIEFQDVVTIEYFNLNTGNVENTQQAIVNISGFVGIEEKNNSFEEIDLFPNPATNKIFIRLNEDYSAKKEVFITDLLGHRILEKTETLFNNELLELDVSSISSGTYIVNIQSSNSIISKRIIIIK